MIICSLKITHDGAIALIDNGALIFSYEAEKINNNNRFSGLSNIFNYDFLDSILTKYEYRIEDIDRFVIDGWMNLDEKNKTENDYPEFVTTFINRSNEKFEIKLNGYGLLIKNEDILKEISFNHLEYDFSYKSYMHISGHVMSAYCTSSFAENQEDSFVLVWDGGMFPQLFYINAETRAIENLGPLFHLLGNSYSIFATNYKPFSNYAGNDLSVSGKVMAYIALGKLDTNALANFKKLFEEHERKIKSNPNLKAQSLIDSASKLLLEFVIYGELNNVKPVDLMTTFHTFIQDILLEQINKLVDKYPAYKKNLCYSGGCALNIKWNSNIRNSGLFEEIWIPPFPNDSGNAIGTACCEMFTQTNDLSLNWSVYAGPDVEKEDIKNDQWGVRDCSIEKLARIIHSHNEPIVFLNGRAELGPRALGNRSILAASVSTEMKLKLNKVKKREEYRPVAPICIEEDAKDIFSPGFPDPFMLFDHKVKDDWKERIPAICHLDGTARLQTVNKKENAEIYLLLQEYKRLSGIPVLCNTSANFLGKGFFPNLSSVMKWGEVNIIWSDGKVYFKKDKIILDF